MLQALRHQSHLFFTSVVLALALPAEALANPSRLAELVRSPIGSFLFKETAEGSELAIRLIGKTYAQRDADRLVRALSVSDDALSESGEQLERRLLSIAQQMEREAGARGLGRSLSRTQKRALQELATRKLTIDSGDRWALNFLPERASTTRYAQARENFSGARVMAQATRTTFFRQAYPANFWEGTLESRIARLVEKYPDAVRLVDDVGFQFQGRSSKRRVLVISRADVSAPDSFLKDYLAAVGRGTISFPMSERGGHLYTRVGGKTIDWFGWKNISPYSSPNSRRLETMIALDPVEEARLIQYVDNVRKNDGKVLGGSNYDGVTSGRTHGELDNNKALRDGEGHNCTTWIATAPVGARGERLFELAGARAAHEVHTSPHWWPYFLSGGAAADRVPMVIYWSDDSLRETLQQVRRGRAFPAWDFDLN